MKKGRGIQSVEHSKVGDENDQEINIIDQNEVSTFL